jgi:phosphate transport system protein
MPPVRQGFSAELEQLRLQVEVMAIRVDQNVERMRTFVATGDLALAATTIAADDDIDAMNVSLTERCHDLLAREAPVASDLRFVVSVMRVLGELERIGDLALRVVKVGEGLDVVRSHADVYDVLRSMADTAVDQYRQALAAWSSQDLGLAEALAGSGHVLDVANDALVHRVLRLDGPDAVAAAVHALVIGRSLDRIADHAAIVGSRLRYLLTGDPGHLAAEIR